MTSSDDVAIDFRKLIKQERKRAKERRKGQEATKCNQRPQKEPSHDELPWNDYWNKCLTEALVLDPVTHCVSRENPRSIYYVPTFLDQVFIDRLIPWLQSLPSGRNESDCNGKWTTMKYGKRRVALFDATNSTGRPLPSPLEALTETLVVCGACTLKPNHVLVNEYTETQGIMPHTDGPLYHDVTATISIGGGDVLLKFTPRPLDTVQNQAENLEVWLQGSGSLVVFQEDAYTNYCHGIDDGIYTEYASDSCVNAVPNTKVTRGYRISLTFRHKNESSS